MPPESADVNIYRRHSNIAGPEGLDHKWVAGVQATTGSCGKFAISRFEALLQNGQIRGMKMVPMPSTRRLSGMPSLRKSLKR